MLQLKFGWWANPIFGTGDYPELMKTTLAKKATELGLPASPLPEFTDEEKKLNKGMINIVHIESTMIVAVQAN